MEWTGSHRLRWPCRLVSELIPPPSCSETSPFCGYGRFLSKAGLGLSQRSRASGRRPSEAGHFRIWVSDPYLGLSPLLPRWDPFYLSGPFRRHTSGTARHLRAPEALRLPGANRERESGLRLGEAWKRGRECASRSAEMEVIPFGAERFETSCTLRGDMLSASSKPKPS